MTATPVPDASVRRLDSHRVRRLVPLTVLALLVGLLGLAPSAGAAPGPAPAPVTRTVLAKVHTDAISTFLDAGNEFVLGSRADAPESGTRYDPAQAWFHVDDASRTVVPTGFEFIGPAGSEAWIAPESNPGGQQLWPGFSTEGVPAGAIAGDTTTFTLTGARAPEGGAVEVYTGGGPYPVTRRWSSDEDRKTFTLGRTHSHANWAFTRAGTYELDVRASVTLAGTPVSDTATYTFVVGPLPEQVSTAIALTTSTSSVVQGSPVTLTAAVNPSSAVGTVEFRRGSTVLGHEPVEDGTASLVVPDLPVGDHEISAHFVPTTTNLASPSTSGPATITVTDASGQQFRITGVASSYQPGDVLSAQAVGVTPGENQTLRWLMRPVATSGTGSNVQTNTSTTLSRTVSIGDDGYEISAALRTVSPAAVVSQTPWIPITVTSDVARPTLTKTSPDVVYNGKYTTADIGGPSPAAGDTTRVVRRTATGGLWSPVATAVIQGASMRVPETSGEADFRYAVQVVRNGLAVAQSEPIAQRTARRETQIAGLRGAYRVGQQIELTGTVFPPEENLSYQWRVLDASSQALHTVDLPVGTPNEAIALTYAPTTAARFVQLFAYEEVPGVGRANAGYAAAEIAVSELPLDQQIFAFANLSGHYHQGDTVNLRLVADPEVADGDAISWEWRWPGESAAWTSFAGPDGLARSLTAEQGLDGVQVRATLDPAAEGIASTTTEPVTIRIDDHGAAPRQQPTLTGPTAYAVDEALALQMTLPANGSTVLTEHRWERQAAGSQEWTVVDGQTGAALTVPATAADDGAAYRVSIVKPNGEVAYGPSPAVTLAVEPEEPVGRQVSIAPLVAHYHSGDVIRATPTAVPALDAGDFLQWQWSFPGSLGQWSYLPECCVRVQELVAEQGLDGAWLRVVLYDADGSYTSEPVMIHVDDHDSPASQVPSVGGPTSFVAGEALAMSRELPAGVPTVLPDHRWERRAEGSAEWTVVEGQAGRELQVAASAADDGASYRVSVVTPAGQVAYGPSAPVTVRVTPETSTTFGLGGMKASYQPGEVLRARVVGRTAAAGQTWRYFVRPVGATGAGTSFSGDGSSYGDTSYAALYAGRVRQTLDSGFDGYEIRARLREGSTYVAGADTAWERIAVATLGTPLSVTWPQGQHHGPDEVALPFTGRLGESESVRLVHRSGGGLWWPATYFSVDRGAGVVRYVEPYPGGTPTEYALQVVRGGVAVSTSAPVTGTVLKREALVQGVRGVYRLGQTLSATAEVYPPLEGMTYSWYLVDADYKSTLLKSGTGQDALSIEIADLAADLDGATLQLETTWEHPEHGTFYPATWSTELRVSSAAPDEQLLFFASLSEHYHQGYDVNLEVVADPALAPEDTVRWEWRWPGEGQDWIPFEGPSGLTHSLVAEQALDGVQVRATVDFAEEGVESMSAETTIHHDDHGGVARQQPTVGGATSYVEGEQLALSLELPENGATVLTTHRWERQAAGSSEWTVVDGESGAELSVPATVADDGASYRVTIMKPNGEVAYGPSPAVTLAVEEAPEVVDPPAKVASTVAVGEVAKVKRGKWASIPIRVTAPRASGAPVTGWVRVRVAGVQRVKKLVNGRATIKVRMRPRATPGAKKAWVTYQGNAALRASRTTTKVVVIR
jgi:surface-anchored protein